jgi:hypothetical protein
MRSNTHQTRPTHLCNHQPHQCRHQPSRRNHLGECRACFTSKVTPYYSPPPYSPPPYYTTSQNNLRHGHLERSPRSSSGTQLNYSPRSIDLPTLPTSPPSYYKSQPEHIMRRTHLPSLLSPLTMLPLTTMRKKPLRSTRKKRSRTISQSLWKKTCTPHRHPSPIPNHPTPTKHRGNMSTLRNTTPKSPRILTCD